MNEQDKEIGELAEKLHDRDVEQKTKIKNLRGFLANKQAELNEAYSRIRELETATAPENVVRAIRDAGYSTSYPVEFVIRELTEVRNRNAAERDRLRKIIDEMQTAINRAGWGSSRYEGPYDRARAVADMAHTISEQARSIESLEKTQTRAVQRRRDLQDIIDTQEADLKAYQDTIDCALHEIDDLRKQRDELDARLVQTEREANALEDHKAERTRLKAELLKLSNEL